MSKLADWLARKGETALQRGDLRPEQRRALLAIRRCRTPAAGGHRYRCTHCGGEHHGYHSCHHRACPRFGALAQIDKHADVPVIVPMTLVDADYFDEIVGGLMGRGVDVRHYALTASVDTIHARLRRRVRAVRVLGADEAWAMQQADRCVTALREKRFATHVPTDNRTVVEVVEFIASHAHLDLVTPRLNAFRYQLHRLAVGVRHVRI